MRKSFLVFVLAVSIICSFTGSFSQAADNSSAYPNLGETTYQDDYTDEKLWGVGASVNYFTGDYNTDTTTNTLYIPLTIRRYLPQGNIAWTIPYIQQDTGPGITAFGGIPFVTDPSATGDRKSASGLGDMLLRGTYYWLTEENHAFNLNPVIGIKIPTADDDEGLGSGEFDETVGFEANKTLNAKWAMNLNVYYTFIGDPEGTDLDNEITASIGPDYYLSDKTTLGLLYEERTTLVSDQTNPRSVIVNLQHKFEETWTAFTAVSAGLSDTSPDFGISLGLNTRF